MRVLRGDYPRGANGVPHLRGRRSKKNKYGGAKMSETIITAVISAVATGTITLIGSLIANSKVQAIMETRLEELTREVREHNGFARRMPVVEEQIKVINHRIADLEHEEK